MLPGTDQSPSFERFHEEDMQATRFFYIHNRFERGIRELPEKILWNLQVIGPAFHPYGSEEFPDHRDDDIDPGHSPYGQQTQCFVVWELPRIAVGKVLTRFIKTLPIGFPEIASTIGGSTIVSTRRSKVH